jgi:hypothetical protein
MFENTDKRQLYWLIDQYLSGKMNAWDFCNKYHDCYDVWLDLDHLSEQEDELFSELSIIASRFSPYDEDHIAQPGFFSTEAVLKKKIVEIKKKLQDDWPSF